MSPELLAHLVPARQLEQRRGFRSTGLAPLDDILEGGWPRAALAELCGRRSSGRTAVLYASLACAIAAEHTVALVDTGGALDPRAAAAAGIALPHLLWIRSPPAQTLKAADLVINAGGFDLVAIDFGDEHPRLPNAAWIRLKHTTERQGTTVLVASPAALVGAFAATRIELSRSTPGFERPPFLASLRSQVTRLRGRHDSSPAPAMPSHDLPHDSSHAATATPSRDLSHDPHNASHDSRPSSPPSAGGAQCAWLVFSHRA